MRRSKKFFFLTTFILLFSSYNPINLKKNKSIFFPIKNVVIEETILIDKNQLRLNLELLKNKSLFFLKNKWIKDSTKEFNFISNISVKKIYPGTIKVKIVEKKPIAIQIVKKKKLYITENNELLDYKDSNFYRNLPTVFGNQKNFPLFLNDIRKINFRIEEIKEFYYFDIGR